MELVNQNSRIHNMMKFASHQLLSVLCGMGFGHGARLVSQVLMCAAFLTVPSEALRCSVGSLIDWNRSFQ